MMIFSIFNTFRTFNRSLVILNMFFILIKGYNKVYKIFLIVKIIQNKIFKKIKNNTLDKF